MHSTGVNNLNAPPQFLKKLWKLVEDPAFDDLISWGPDGTTFIIKNQSQFAKDVLPLYFKHNKIASFIRQLNMYGFSKIANIEQGGLKSERDDQEFHHDEGFFIRGQEDLLALIKRKISSGKGQDNAVSKTAGINQFYIDVSHLKNKHDNMENSFANLKRENEVIWRELGSLRQKYSKQQQIINQMIHFLARMFQGNSNRGVATKRKIPLMLTEPKSKIEKTSGLHFSLEDPISNIQVDSPLSGPVIHDITDTEVADVKPFVSLDSTTEEPVNEISAVLKQLVESKEKEKSTNENTDDIKPLLTEALNRCDIPSTSASFPLNESPESINAQSTVAIRTPNDLAEHLVNTQSELESMRDILQNTFGFDASTLLEMYNLPDDIMPSGASFLDEINEDKNEVTGNEIVQYHPSLLELADEDVNFFQNSANVSDIVNLGAFENDCILSDLPESDTLNTPILPEDGVVNNPDPILPNVALTEKKTT